MRQNDTVGILYLSECPKSFVHIQKPANQFPSDPKVQIWIRCVLVDPSQKGAGAFLRFQGSSSFVSVGAFTGEPISSADKAVPIVHLESEGHMGTLDPPPSMGMILSGTFKMLIWNYSMCGAKCENCILIIRSWMRKCERNRLIMVSFVGRQWNLENIESNSILLGLGSQFHEHHWFPGV